MRIRVPVSMRNRVRKLERRERRDLPVGGWPPVMGVEEWEALASRMQDALVSASLSDTEKPATLEAMLMPQATECRTANQLSKIQGLSAVEEYLQAQLKARERRA